MIVVKMQGGLGNQLFQYAMGRAVSIRLSCRLLLDISWYSRPPAEATQRVFGLADYPVCGETVDWGVFAPFYFSVPRLGCVVADRDGIRVARSFYELGLGYQPSAEHIRVGSFLEGYWQSPKYFDDISSLLRREFVPLKAMTSKDAEVAALIEAAGKASVAVHVRRGDYLKSVHRAHHGVCSDEYYIRALSYIKARLGGARLFVFSDDPDWVSTRSDIFTNAVVVRHNSQEDAFQDLRLMSLCQSHVIANSSFSWWGAWLSSGGEKLVIAPTCWLADGWQAPDLLPAGWIRL